MALLTAIGSTTAAFLQRHHHTVSATRTDIVLLGSDNPTTWIVYNALIEWFGPLPALVEPTVPKLRIFRNRVRKLGLPRALSQVGFVLLVRPILRRKSRARIRQICQRFGLETMAPLTRDIRDVPSANSAECLALLKQWRPSVVVVNGARILSPATLAQAPGIFLNTHQGITPRYRGAHGAYWALYEGDPQNCGVTVHVIDEGIDTGDVIAQAHITPEASDCFVTYPYLQTAAALPQLRQAVEEALHGRLKSTPVSGPSGLWHHPGLLQYLLGLLLRGVK